MRGIRNPAPIQLCWVAATYAQAGDIETAKGIARELITAAGDKLTSVGAAIPGDWSEFMALRWPFKQPEDTEHFLAGLRKAGMSD
jgi:hypothetical protein